MHIKEEDIKQIRKSIRKTSELLKNDKIVELDNITVKRINCYAYSLGIMKHSSGTISFGINFTENTIFCMTNPNKIIRGICRDLENLKIPFRKINLEESKILKDDEYLVKVFYALPSDYHIRGDFHFIRQDRRSGKWFHKMGWYNQPEFVKSSLDTRIDFDINGEPIMMTSEGLYYKSLTYFAINENN